MQNSHIFASGVFELIFDFVFDRSPKILLAKVKVPHKKRLIIAQIVQLEQRLRVELAQIRNILDKLYYIQLVRVQKLAQRVHERLFALGHIRQRLEHFSQQLYLSLMQS